MDALTKIKASDLDWIHITILAGTPLIALVGALTTPLTTPTLIWSIIYYFFTGLGITAGYHRYWAHRAYDATRAWQFVILAAATGAMEGSAKWWCRGHRIHHRFTDTEKDPYNAKNGFFWSHLGWMIMKQ
ncbi:hypothetical protein BC830DRAFT_1070773, partial [Chytriomyces sp. MP71]